MAHAPSEQVPEQHCRAEEQETPSELQVHSPLLQRLEQHCAADAHAPPWPMHSHVPPWQLPEQQSADDEQLPLCTWQAVALSAILVHWPTRGTLPVSLSPLPLLSW